MTQNDWTYARAGVDIEQKSRSIASLVNRLTYRRTGKGRVIDIKGQFTSLIDFDGTVLTLCTDGVGTKLLIAEALDKWDTVGIDCMAMNVNDTICVGAEPFAFVDYIAIDRPDERITEQIGIGLERAAEECNVDIVGGEIAVLPEIVRGVDLSGSALGWLEKEKIVDGSKVRSATPSSGSGRPGIHSNGMTLARKVLESVEIKLDEKFDRLGKTIGQELLTPTELYVKKVVELVDKVKIHGMVDVTGGGLKNFVRLKKDVLFEITEPIRPQPVFEIIAELGNVDPRRCTRPSTWAWATGSCCHGRTSNGRFRSSAKAQRWSVRFPRATGSEFRRWAYTTRTTDHETNLAQFPFARLRVRWL